MASRLRSEEMRILLHFLGALEFSFGAYYASRVKFRKIDTPDKTGLFWSPMKFIGFWNLGIEAIYFQLCLLNDFFGSNEEQMSNPPILRVIKDYLMSTVVFPLSMLLGLTFWALYSVDRELVHPENFDMYIPLWLKHLMHTNIMTFTLLEMALCHRRHPGKKGVLGVVFLLLICAVWNHIVYYKTNQWTYLILDILEGELLLFFYAFMLAFGIFLYFAGEYVNTFFWKCYLRTVRIE